MLTNMLTAVHSPQKNVTFKNTGCSPKTPSYWATFLFMKLQNFRWHNVTARPKKLAQLDNFKSL